MGKIPSALEQQLRSPPPTLPLLMPKPPVVQTVQDVQQTFIPLTFAPVMPLTPVRGQGVRHEPYPHSRRGSKTGAAGGGSLDTSTGKSQNSSKSSVTDTSAVENIPANVDTNKKQQKDATCNDSSVILAGLSEQPSSPTQGQSTFSTSTPVKLGNTSKADTADGENGADDAADTVGGKNYEAMEGHAIVKVENVESDDLDLELSGAAEGTDGATDVTVETSADSTNNTASSSDLQGNKSY